MVVHEPMTMATDYLLALASLVFGVLLLRRGSRLWAWTFFATAAGSAFGGTYHGLADPLWWKPAVYSIGLAAFFLLLAATRNRTIHLVALVQFVAYASWMITHDSFAFVIADYGIALLILCWVELFAWARTGSVSAPWIISSVAVSAAAAAVQQMPFELHNDVYHLLQLLALWLLYRGAVQPEASPAVPVAVTTERSTIPPR